VKILLVDDDEDVIQDYRECLRADGHEVQWTNTLDDALMAIRLNVGTACFDLIVIDIMLGCTIPSDLLAHCEGLGKQHLNEGQALGRWLWLVAGRWHFEQQPMHCYFSAVTQHYQPWKDSVEFDGIQGRESFLISKWSVMPGEISATLEAVVSTWKDGLLKQGKP
jgi:hypothetical protein